MIKYFVVFLLLFSFCTSAREPNIKIELENKNNNLRLYLINYGGDVLINTKFSLKQYPPPPDAQDPPPPPDVKFEIVNQKGIKYPFALVHIDEPSLEEQDIALLKYRNIVGHEFHITTLMLFYNLTAGKYKARVIYENTEWEDKGVYIGRLTSNWVTFEVPEKKEDIVWP